MMQESEYRVQGFTASAVKVGLKKDKALDLALIVSEKETAVAGVFTTNKVVAAPVIVSREHVKSGGARAIIANAGNANACTGKAGLNNARRTAQLVADEMGIGADEVLVASTGVIGQPLNVDRIAETLPSLIEGLSPDGIPHAARAIMTTDSFAKICHFEGSARGRPYRILGIAKGAGMIMPNMATMLCFMMSDISIDSHDLKAILSSSVATTFNRISVDGDTSTNDTVLDRLDHAGANLFLGQGPQHGGVYQDHLGLLERADQVLALGQIDAGLGPHAGVRHRQERRGHLGKADAPHKGCRRKARYIARHAAAQ